MKKKALFVVLGLGALAGIGFAIAKSKTNGGAGTFPPGDTPPGSGAEAARQYAEITRRDGNYIAIIYVDGAPSVSYGPRPDVTEIKNLVHARMKADSQRIYFMIMQDATTGAWWTAGFKDGADATQEMGPYADQALAIQSGTTWAMSAAVPVPTPGAG